jgi:hypothetical protein
VKNRFPHRFAHRYNITEFENADDVAEILTILK